MRLPLALVVTSQMFAGVAAADPYPFSGFYALEAPGRAGAGCGFDILHQSRDGAFSGYLLDRPHWDAHKEARFLRYKHGTCTFDSRTAIDNCVTQTNHIDDPGDAKPDRAKITVLDDHAVAMLTLGADDDPQDLAGVPPFVFKRCPFDEEQILPRLSDSVAGYSQSELKAMARSRDPDLSGAVVRAITRAGNSAE